jgi:transposase InsO family protein
MPIADNQQAAKFIYEEIICHHRIVNIVHSNQGTHFVNEIISTLINKFDIKYHKVIAYHLQANGLVECFNRILKKTLAKLNEETNEWDELISPTLFTYQSSPNPLTQLVFHLPF